MPPRSFNKVFGVGMHRTGTSSLRRAFNELGLRCLEDEGCWFMSELGPDGTLRFRPSAPFDRYDAYADNPVPLFVSELDELFPESRFVLTHRDVDEWVDSVAHIFDAWWNDWRKLPEHALIDACHTAFYGHARFDPRRGREAYLRHNESVRRHFGTRPGDLLELDITRGDGWSALCRFLAVEQPGTPFPLLNTRVDAG